jgi:hypothetical protein
MPANPDHPLTIPEKITFGHDAKRHPITGLVLEQGSGCLSPDDQARIVHLPYIAETEGVEAAQAMLTKLDAAAAEAKKIELEAAVAEIKRVVLHPRPTLSP